MCLILFTGDTWTKDAIRGLSHGFHLNRMPRCASIGSLQFVISGPTQEKVVKLERIKPEPEDSVSASPSSSVNLDVTPYVCELSYRSNIA